MLIRLTKSQCFNWLNKIFGQFYQPIAFCALTSRQRSVLTHRQIWQFELGISRGERITGTTASALEIIDVIGLSKLRVQENHFSITAPICRISRHALVRC